MVGHDNVLKFYDVPLRLAWAGMDNGKTTLTYVQFIKNIHAYCL